jgi:type I restriction enzyme S subunit
LSRIDDLIDELCPDGVPYKLIGDIATVVRGASPRPIQNFITDDEDGVPWIKIGDVPAGGKYITRTTQRITADGAAKSRRVYPGDFVLSNSMSFGRPYITKIEGCIHDGWLAISDFSESFAPDFLYHLLGSPRIQEEFARRAGVGAVQNLNADIVKAVVLPVPPLEVQSAIVDVLDLFGSLHVELEAELKARRLQYTHYRTTLFTFGEDDVDWSTLGDVCTQVSTGATPLKSRSDYYENGDIPWLRTQEVIWRDIYDTEISITDKAVQETAVKWIPENCVIVAISGASAARAAVNKIRLTTNQHCCNLEIDPSRASYRYVFHWVASNYEKLKARGQGARSDLNVAIIKAFPIALPSLEGQERIADLLDRFDTLVNNTDIGLPAEIASRRMQYEHYRDRLLTFGELAV